ncbi:MAG: hypothetical protein KJ981_11635 [Alphaproteobacteria bacterium]|uniref:hypothetical protein n=1 Tax=Rhizobium sp. R86522 TaxID=3093861 RepID=UPI00366E85E0|nr:hypothetical protein [Alphaproteobacteria bacterium]MBU0832990.1 hypothetical protein [Alphaproteobacteria bacterium]MBU1764540.1 hypothetical protein [Alphaproteobacteria bacterium]
MVERISRISSSEASSQTESGQTLSLGSDAQNAWVAARQSKINHDLEERHQQDAEEKIGQDSPVEDGGDVEEKRFSGESERIGTQNFDENTPFGERVAIV